MAGGGVMSWLVDEKVSSNKFKLGYWFFISSALLILTIPIKFWYKIFDNITFVNILSIGRSKKYFFS